MQKLILSIFFAVLVHMACAQVYDANRHNTNYNTAWLSCISSTNPNPERGEGHWINYDLRNNYDIFQLSFWNLNDPARLTEGLKDIIIDVSADGNTWEEAGTYTIPASGGSSFYNGTSGLNLNGVTARYVLITALNNHGGECYGLSEVKIEVQEAVLPVTLIDIYAECETNGEVALSWEVESEFNNDSYTVQSSLDGKSWKHFTKVEGQNRKERNIYSVTDNNYPGGVKYYRVIQTDYDGSESVFPMVYAECFTADLQATLHPNPTSSDLTIGLKSSSGDQQNYKIKNISGQVIMKGTLNNGDNILNLSHMDSGTYFITISDDRAIFQRKIIKI